MLKATVKSKQNIAKYLRRLIELNFAYLAEKRGRSVFYQTSPELALLRGDANWRRYNRNVSGDRLAADGVCFEVQWPPEASTSQRCGLVS